LFGPAAIILSVIAKTKNERLSNVAIAVSILGLVIGSILGAIVWSMF
jgi:Na+/glutamate symporter